MACIGGHADVLKVLVEEFGMSTNISDFVSRSSHMQCSIPTYSQCICIIHSLKWAFTQWTSVHWPYACSCCFLCILYTVAPYFLRLEILLSILLLRMATVTAWSCWCIAASLIQTKLMLWADAYKICQCMSLQKGSSLQLYDSMCVTQLWYTDLCGTGRTDSIAC